MSNLNRALSSKSFFPRSRYHYTNYSNVRRSCVPRFRMPLHAVIHVFLGCQAAKSLRCCYQSRRRATERRVHDRRAGCVTNASASSRCCTKDGSRPPEVGLQEQASNRPVLLRSKGVVVNNWGKDFRTGGQVRVEEMSESKPADDASLRVKKLPKVGSPPAP
jgi:hypothetical protein